MASRFAVVPRPYAGTGTADGVTGTIGRPWRTFLERSVAVLAAVLVLVASGTLGFVLLDGWPLSDASWMTIITITGVGYDEVRGLTPATRVLATGLLAGGLTMMGIWFAVLTGAIVEMDLGHEVRTRRDMKNIEKLEDHVIVCGAGRTGQQIMAEMKTAGVPYVVIDIVKERAEQIQQADDDALVLVADATRDESLTQAGIERARGLVACLSQDTDNLFVCLSARDLNPDLTIVARAYEEQTMQKLYVAGADHVVSPNVTGGVRMASVLLRPSVVTFLDVVARGEDVALRFEQIEITDDSPLAGQTLQEARIPQRTGLIVIAIRLAASGEGAQWRYNPGPDESMHAGDTLIVLGKPEQLDELTVLAG